MSQLELIVEVDEEQLTLLIEDAVQHLEDISAEAGNILQREVDGLYVPDTSVDKVDKVVGKSLVDDLEIAKLLYIEAEATKNRPDTENADKVHSHDIGDVTGLQNYLDGKVDKEVGKSLISDAELLRLATVATDATKNAPDSSLRDRSTHTGTQPINTVEGLTDALVNKVDKVAGYSLVADDEIAKLLTVEQDAQKNTVSSVAGRQGDVLLDKEDVGLGAVDNTSDADKPVSTSVAAALAGKVDKVHGKGLSDENYTLAEKQKLGGIAVEATKNRDDSENADKLHTHTTAQVAGLDSALESKASKTELTTGLGLKVDKEAGKQLSDTNFTQVEKTKLADIASEATKNRADILNADKVHTHVIDDVTGLSTRLNDIDALIGDVESVLVAINGEP